MVTRSNADPKVQGQNSISMRAISPWFLYVVFTLLNSSHSFAFLSFSLSSHRKRIKCGTVSIRPTLDRKLYYNAWLTGAGHFYSQFFTQNIRNTTGSRPVYMPVISLTLLHFRVSDEFIILSINLFSMRLNYNLILTVFFIFLHISSRYYLRETFDIFHSLYCIICLPSHRPFYFSRFLKINMPKWLEAPCRKGRLHGISRAIILRIFDRDAYMAGHIMTTAIQMIPSFSGVDKGGLCMVLLHMTNRRLLPFNLFWSRLVCIDFIPLARFTYWTSSALRYLSDVWAPLLRHYLFLYTGYYNFALSSETSIETFLLLLSCLFFFISAKKIFL